LPSNGTVEHPTKCDTIDRSGMDAEANGQPGGTTGVLSRAMVIGKNPSNHVFVDLNVER